MPTPTADQGIIQPDAPDPADTPDAFNDQIGGLLPRLVRQYTNLAQRTAIVTAPAVNQVTALAAEGRMDAYNGSAYVSLTARGLYARVERTANATPILSNTTLQSDSVLTVALDTIGRYKFNGRLYYDASATADIKVAFTFPLVAANGSKWGLLGRNATTNTNVEALVATASGVALAAGATGVGTSTFLDFEGFLNITATGSLVTQYAQNTTDATNLTVQFGSYLEVMKVG